MQFRIAFLLMFILMVSCSETIIEDDAERIGWQYFPVNLGSYRIYQVNETRYSLVGAEELDYQLRESVVDSTKAGEEIRLIMHRETRSDETENWQLDSVWTAKINPHRAILVENNVPLIKLSFPIENEITWDGNAFNARSEDTYQYDRTLQDTVLFETAYADLWKVVQSDLGEDFLGRNDRYEVYAPGAGLIIKEVIIWNYCQSDCTSEKQIVNGRELHQTILSYGNLQREDE